MPEPSKKLKTMLRKYAERAWEAEMKAALGALAAKFDDWKAGTMSTEDLHTAIHEYHDGIARQIWKRFSTSDKKLPLAHAVAAGFVAADSLPAELVEHIRSTVALFEDQGREK